MHAMVSTEWPICLHLPYKGMTCHCKEEYRFTVDPIWWVLLGLLQLNTVLNLDQLHGKLHIL